MNLTLVRSHIDLHATVGSLAVDGGFQWFTLEPGSGDGKGPIPAGGYDVVIDFSQRFQRRMPHILDVPGFDGIRIHPGNTDKDTEGCILVGQQSDGRTCVLNSRAAFNELFQMLDESLSKGEACRITISQEAA